MSDALPFKVERFGDWTPRKSPLEGIPKELREASRRWLRDGGEFGDPRLAAVMRAQHVALIKTLAGVMDKVDALANECCAEQLADQEALSESASVGEQYARAYQSGEMAERDRWLDAIRQLQHELRRHNEAAAASALEGL